MTPKEQIYWTLGWLAKRAFECGVDELEWLNKAQRAYREHATRKLRNHPNEKNRRQLYLNARKVCGKNIPAEKLVPLVP